MKFDNCIEDLISVRTFIDDIWDYINQDQYDIEEIDNGLLLLFLFTYASWKCDQNFYDKAFEFTNLIIEKLIHKEVQGAYFYGVTGVLVAIDLLARNNLIEASSYQDLSPLEESVIVKMVQESQKEMELLELTLTGQFLLQRYIVRRHKNLYRNNIHIALLQLLNELFSRDLQKESYYRVCVIRSFLKNCRKEKIIPQLIDDYVISKKKTDSTLDFLCYDNIFNWHRNLKKDMTLEEIECFAKKWTDNQRDLFNSINNNLLLSLIFMNFCFDQNKAYQNYLLFK